MHASIPLSTTRRLEGHQGWRTRLGVLAVALIAAVVGGVIHAPAAAAHGGPIELHVSPDGVGGLNLFATYVEDGHTVTAIMDPVVEAVSDDGTIAGPVSLVSSSEGEGRWVAEEPFLGFGDWTVTVTTTTPEEASATVEFTVEPLDPPVEVEAAPEPEPEPTAAGESDEPAAQAGATDGDGGLPVAVIIAVVAAIAVLLIAAVVIARRRNSGGDVPRSLAS